MEWPVSGDVLIDYSMDGAVYFPTLEVYKYNPAVILSAQADQQVLRSCQQQGVVRRGGFRDRYDCDHGYGKWLSGSLRTAEGCNG